MDRGSCYKSPFAEAARVSAAAAPAAAAFATAALLAAALARHSLAGAARFGETDRDRLLAARDFLAAPAAAKGALLFPAHR